VIGVDPGLDGCAAAIDGHGTPIALLDTPTLTIGGARATRDYALPAMAAWLRQFTVLDTNVVIERQQAMPAVLRGRKQGTASSFATGKGFGVWLGLVVGLGLRYTLVHPARWRASMGLPRGSGKEGSRHRAMQLFPSTDLRLKKHEARAEALLMAEYLRRDHVRSGETVAAL